MTNKPKAIGTACESAVVGFLERPGVLALRPRRIALCGALDEGDIEYEAPAGFMVVVQVKGGHAAEKASEELIEKWTLEAERQAAQTGTTASFLVTKRAGFGPVRAELWRAHCRGRTLGLDTGGVVSMNLATMVALIARVEVKP